MRRSRLGKSNGKFISLTNAEESELLTFFKECQDGTTDFKQHVDVSEYETWMFVRILTPDFTVFGDNLGTLLTALDKEKRQRASIKGTDLEVLRSDTEDMYLSLLDKEKIEGHRFKVRWSDYTPTVTETVEPLD